jgi:hypothetical protein
MVWFVVLAKRGSLDSLRLARQMAVFWGTSDYMLPPPQVCQQVFETILHGSISGANTSKMSGLTWFITKKTRSVANLTWFAI